SPASNALESPLTLRRRNDMTKSSGSSRLRFLHYRHTVREQQRAGKTDTATSDSPAQHRAQHRSFWQLVRQFLELLRGHRTALSIALATLTASTLLKLVPPGAR